jgi:hypothetical protein
MVVDAGLSSSCRKSVTDRFTDTTLQTAASTNVAYGMTFYTTAPLAYGVASVRPASRIVVRCRESTTCSFRRRWINTSGGDETLYIWPRINGNDVPNQRRFFRIKGNDAEVVPSWNFLTANERHRLF